MILRSAVPESIYLDIYLDGLSAVWTLHEAKNKFSAVVEAALAGRPQGISRRGLPAVVVVSAASYEQLLVEARQVRGSFVDHLLAMPSETAGRQGTERARVAPRDVSF